MDRSRFTASLLLAHEMGAVDIVQVVRLGRATLHRHDLTHERAKLLVETKKARNPIRLLVMLDDYEGLV